MPDTFREVGRQAKTGLLGERSMVGKWSLRICPLFLMIALLLFLVMEGSQCISARSSSLATSPISLQASIRSGQPATDYDGLVFWGGSRGSLYSFDLVNERLYPIADGTGTWLSISPDGRMIAFDLEGQLYLALPDATELRRAVDTEGDVGLASWSPDGLRLAYELGTSWPAADSGLYVLDLDTLESKRITSQDLFVRRSIAPVSWLPDGKHILFRACQDLPGTKRDSLGISVGVAHYDLYMVNVNGEDLTNLTNGVGNLMDFHLSPDGQVVILTSHLENQLATQREGYRVYDSEVYLMSLETKGTVKVANVPMGDQGLPLGWYAFPWSPDSKWALLPTRWPGTWQTISSAGTLHRDIIDVSGFTQGDAGLDWLMSGLSPDGKTLAGRGRFQEGGNECLCAVDADGENFRVLVPDIYLDSFVWSPDGKSIFLKYTLEEYGSAYRYGIVNADGSGFYEPFANLCEKPTPVEGMRWVRFPASAPRLTASPTPTLTPSSTIILSQTPTAAAFSTTTSFISNATATASSANTARPAPTSIPGNGICTLFGVVLFAVIVAWWFWQRRG
jgi:WD40 repeat protein